MALQRRAITITRDAIVFTAGLVVFLSQAFLKDMPNAALIYGSLAAMGVSAFLRGVSITVDRNGEKK